MEVERERKKEQRYYHRGTAQAHPAVRDRFDQVIGGTDVERKTSSPCFLEFSSQLMATTGHANISCRLSHLFHIYFRVRIRFTTGINRQGAPTVGSLAISFTLFLNKWLFKLNLLSYYFKKHWIWARIQMIQVEKYASFDDG